MYGGVFAYEHSAPIHEDPLLAAVRTLGAAVARAERDAAERAAWAQQSEQSLQRERQAHNDTGKAKERAEAELRRVSERMNDAESFIRKLADGRTTPARTKAQRAAREFLGWAEPSA